MNKNSLNKNQEALKLLDQLNKKYFKLHKQYEDLFWLSYMGDHSIDDLKNKALADRDVFRSDSKNISKINELIKKVDLKTKKRLDAWLKFFNRYQMPAEAMEVKEKIDLLESEINKKRASRKEGYIDPYTKKFVVASELKMSTMVATNSDEKIRKACFEAGEKLAVEFINDYVELIKLRNEFAVVLKYKDFYDYKVRLEDGMTKEELFSIFDKIYQKTKYALGDIIKLEKSMPGLRKPWNFGYMMAGDFTKEEDQYFQFDEALMRWGKSFAAMGVEFRQGKLQLDLLDRKGKWNNGFCHWPDLVRFENGKRYPGSSNFTCNVVFGQVGSGHRGYETLFHEGGHAAHFLNVDQMDVCSNNEYSPMSASQAETHSMFFDTLFDDMAWRVRYAVNKKGEPYPFELFERKTKKLHILNPLFLNGIIFVSNFEKEIYEEKNLNKEKAIAIAKKNYLKYFSRSQDSLRALNVPHIYGWESSASYHGYGLATLALYQWREYFLKKYGYIIDNPKIGKDMAKMWKLGSTKTFKEFVISATGKKLSADAFLKDATMTVSQILTKAKKDIDRVQKIKPHNKPVKLNAKISMVHGKKEIANNKKSFEDMAENYKKWLRKNK